MSEAKSPRVWFITGSSSGFGLLLAKEVLRRGERVIATARDASKLDDLPTLYPDSARVFTLDVTKPTRSRLSAASLPPFSAMSMCS
jgi:NADP-dependent 3-hydroxy acid dehydrogenase YdfG